MDVFDKIPPNSQIFGDRPDRAEPKHFEHCQSKGSNITVSPNHKGKRRPPKRRAPPALQTMENQLQQALLVPYGTHEEPPALLTFEARIPAAALRVPDLLIVHLGAENDPVGHKMGRSVLNTLQPKSVVQYRCGHGLGLLRIVRLPSNNTDPAMSIFNFQLSRYPFAGRPV
jgi:hypothetical protein